jgi:hypothetical protein
MYPVLRPPKSGLRHPAAGPPDSTDMDRMPSIPTAFRFGVDFPTRAGSPEQSSDLYSMTLVAAIGAAAVGAAAEAASHLPAVTIPGCRHCWTHLMTADARLDALMVVPVFSFLQVQQ